MDLKGIVGKVLDGKAAVERIGSSRVAADADRAGLVTAIETANLAQQFSSVAKGLWRSGDFEGAINGLCQSVVLEESIGNIWGISSDLGNVAEIYRQLKAHVEAEDIFSWLRAIDKELISEAPQAGDLRKIDIPEPQLRDYYLLQGLHTEGLARVYIATGRRSLAVELMDEILQSYRRAENAEHVANALSLLDWLNHHPA